MREASKEEESGSEKQFIYELYEGRDSWVNTLRPHLLTKLNGQIVPPTKKANVSPSEKSRKSYWQIITYHIYRMKLYTKRIASN